MNRRSSQTGFSLVELLVASAIFFTFVVSILSAYAQGHQSYRRGQDRIEAQQNARIAVESMVRDLRMTGYDPSNAIRAQAVPAAVQVAEQNTLTVLADLDGDQVTDQVRYRQEGGFLIRELSTWDGTSFNLVSESQIADGMRGLAFGYFDASVPVNTAFVTPVVPGQLDRIRRVSISVLTSQTTLGRQESFPLVTDIALRNVE